MPSILMIGIREGCEVFDFQPMSPEVSCGSSQRAHWSEEKVELFQRTGFVRAVIVGVMRRCCMGLAPFREKQTSDDH